MLSFTLKPSDRLFHNTNCMCSHIFVLPNCSSNKTTTTELKIRLIYYYYKIIINYYLVIILTPIVNAKGFQSFPYVSDSLVNPKAENGVSNGDSDSIFGPSIRLRLKYLTFFVFKLLLCMTVLKMLCFDEFTLEKEY